MEPAFDVDERRAVCCGRPIGDLEDDRGVVTEFGDRHDRRDENGAHAGDPGETKLVRHPVVAVETMVVTSRHGSRDTDLVLGEEVDERSSANGECGIRRRVSRDVDGCAGRIGRKRGE